MAGLYIHVPFCLGKCDYCTFYSVVGDTSAFERYLTSLQTEIDKRLQKGGEPFETCFVGGGNPTCIGEKNFAALAAMIGSVQQKPFEEITFESNPETLTPEVVKILSDIPNIRLSMGIQRLKNEELKILGRRSSVDIVHKALERACGALKNVSADIIMGVPGCPSIADELRGLAGRFPLSHISAYFLSVEPGSRLQARIEADELPDPQDIGPEELFDVRNVLADFGFEHYEISNYAKKGCRCLHNMNYWKPGNYMGFGPSAVSTVDDRRFTNPADFEKWAGPFDSSVEELSVKDRRNEYLMLRLRLLTDGLLLNELTDRFGEQTEEFRQTLDECLGKGTLKREGSRVTLTPSGLVIADEVMGGLFE